MEPSHVLVPLDGSPLADAALTHALSVFECPVTVLNVVTPLDSGMSEGGVLDIGDARETTARERAERLIDRAESRAAAENRTVETAIESGDPAEAILGYAETHDVDHIVMGGTRRRSGRARRPAVGDRRDDRRRRGIGHRHRRSRLIADGDYRIPRIEETSR